MRRGRDGERGFTLIELMVVVLIIAILILIAIPTFAGARQTANDRAAQSNVRNAFVAARVYYEDHLRYTATPASMTDIEPSLRWTNAPPESSHPPRSVYVRTFDNDQTVVVATRGADGRCFYLKDVMGGSTDPAGTFYDTEVPGSAPCPVPDPLATTWSAGWTNE